MDRSNTLDPPTPALSQTGSAAPTPGPLRWLGEALATRAAVYVAAVLGMALATPSLTNGLIVDDYWQFSMAHAESPAWDLFHFLPVGSPHLPGPWVSDGSYQAAFLRPLPSLLHYLEYRYVPASTHWMHLHNILWYGFCVVAVGFAYRAIEGRRWHAGLAVLLLSVNVNHGFTVGWLAARCMVIASTFGALTLGLHHRARRLGQRPWQALVCFAAMLTTGEVALPMLGYLVAHALWVDEGPLWARARVLGPYLALAGAWFCFGVLAGYGVENTVFYVDYRRGPGEALPEIAANVLQLFELQFGLARLEAWAGGASLLLLVSLAASIGVLARHRPMLGFWATGTLLAALPVSLAYPQARLLLPVNLGAAMMVTRMMRGVVLPSTGPHRHGPAWLFAGAFGALTTAGGLVYGPLLLPQTARSYEPLAADFRQFARSLSGYAERHVVLLDVPYWTAPRDFGAVLDHEQRPVPLSVVQLASTSRLTVRTAEPDALELRSETGIFGPLRYIRRVVPSHVGDTIPFSGGRLEVLEVGSDGIVIAARATFLRPLSDPNVAFLTRSIGRTEAVELPDPGETIELGW